MHRAWLAPVLTDLLLAPVLPPNAGTVIVEGRDIRREMPTIYSLMGVCPQDNLLWERLTAREHLSFYGRLKNLQGMQLKAAVDEVLQKVNLFNGGVGDKQVRLGASSLCFAVD